MEIQHEMKNRRRKNAITIDNGLNMKIEISARELPGRGHYTTHNNIM
jgi:hypothetical protein